MLTSDIPCRQLSIRILRHPHLDLHQILPGRLRHSEHGNDAGSLELDDVGHIDALWISIAYLSGSSVGPEIRSWSHSSAFSTAAEVCQLTSQREERPG